MAVSVGKDFPLSVASPASGRWAEKHPFRPETYGKIRGYNPIGSEDPKIVLCTLSLDKDFFRLAAAVDAFLAKHKGLECSVIQVADIKGAQQGGYTLEEASRRIEELRKLARQYKIEHLSFALSTAPASYFSDHLGFTDHANFLAAYLAPEDSPNAAGRVKWVSQGNTAKLADKAIQEIIDSLEKSIPTP